MLLVNPISQIGVIYNSSTLTQNSLFQLKRFMEVSQCILEFHKRGISISMGLLEKFKGKLLYSTLYSLTSIISFRPHNNFISRLEIREWCSLKKKRKKAKWLPTVPWLHNPRSYSINDTFKNRVEYPCWQTPGQILLLYYNVRKSYFESKNAHSSSWKNHCNVQKELTIRTTAIRMYKDWALSKSHVLKGI